MLFDLSFDSKATARFIKSFTALFFFLCFLHFFTRRPLWLDENFVVANLQSKTFAQLLGPLTNSQAFPRVYLLIVKFLGEISNYHLLALRLCPLAAIISAFYVWRNIFRQTLSDNFQFLLGVLTFVCSYHIVYYAAELKPYSMDVLAVGIFALFLSNQKRFVTQTPTQADYFQICSLPLLLLFSYGAGFVFWIVGFNFLFLVRNNKTLWPLIAGYSCVSLVMLGIIYQIDLRHSFKEQGLFNYWDSYFLCSESISCFFESFWEGIRRMSTWWLGKEKIFLQTASPFIGIFMYTLVRYGFGQLKKDQFRIFTVDALLAVMFLELMVFGMLKKYPFTGTRITLFFAPFIFYMLVKGINDMKRIKFLYYFFLPFYVVFLLLCAGNGALYFLSLYK
jgi:hypothetical protein